MLSKSNSKKTQSDNSEALDSNLSEDIEIWFQVDASQIQFNHLQVCDVEMVQHPRVYNQVQVVEKQTLMSDKKAKSPRVVRLVKRN